MHMYVILLSGSIVYLPDITLHRKGAFKFQTFRVVCDSLGDYLVHAISTLNNRKIQYVINKLIIIHTAH